MRDSESGCSEKPLNFLNIKMSVQGKRKGKNTKESKRHQISIEVQLHSLANVGITAQLTLVAPRTLLQCQGSASYSHQLDACTPPKKGTSRAGSRHALRRTNRSPDQWSPIAQRLQRRPMGSWTRLIIGEIDHHAMRADWLGDLFQPHPSRAGTGKWDRVSGSTLEQLNLQRVKRRRGDDSYS
jgi:hypothetical protein